MAKGAVWRRRLSLALLALALLAALVGSLIGGLAGSALHSGRLDPLDWGLPVLLGILLPGAWLWWHRAKPDLALLLLLGLSLAVPPCLLVGLAASRMAWLSGAALMLLAMAAAIVLAAGLVVRRGGSGRGLLLASGIAALAALGCSALASHAPQHRAQTAVIAMFSALPLHGARALQDGGLSAPSGRSALDVALLPALRLRPVDALDVASLRGASALLVAQPRALAPAELVALDGWVRAGGRALILTDPQLLWEGPFPFSHPLAPPRSSTLLPLLAHWGLALAPAGERKSDPVVRQALADGALLQLAAPGIFTPIAPTAAATGCTVAEAGLIARCRVGQGEALVVADADWINPDLWSLAPQNPQERRQWTADTPDVLAGWLLREPAALPDTGFLRDVPALVSALRLAALAAMAFAFLIWIMIRAQLRRAGPAIPTAAQDTMNTKQEQTGMGGATQGP